MTKLERLLNALPLVLQVEFAVYCCNDIRELIPKEALHALELTEKWLMNPPSVAKQELGNAVHAAYDVYVEVNAHSAYAVHAAYAAHAANAAYAAAHTAYAAHAVYAAHSAYAAAHAAVKEEEKLEQYETHLINMIANLTELEKTIYEVGL